MSLSKLYRAFTESRTREKWLPGVDWKVRTTAADKSMRVTWEDGTSVELYFVPKGPEKSQVAVAHRKLRNKAQAAKAKAYWGERLDGLAGLLARRRRS